MKINFPDYSFWTTGAGVATIVTIVIASLLLITAAISFVLAHQQRNDEDEWSEGLINVGTISIVVAVIGGLIAFFIIGPTSSGEKINARTTIIQTALEDRYGISLGNAEMLELNTASEDQTPFGPIASATDEAQWDKDSDSWSTYKVFGTTEFYSEKTGLVEVTLVRELDRLKLVTNQQDTDKMSEWEELPVSK